MNNITLQDFQKALSEKSVVGLNALVATLYDSDVERACEDINRYWDSSCSAISWYISDFSDKELKRFYDLVADDLTDFLDNRPYDSMLQNLDFEDFEISYLFTYGLDPACLPKIESRNSSDRLLIMSNKKRVILGFVGDIIYQLTETVYETE